MDIALKACEIIGQTDRDMDWAESKASLTVYTKRNEPVQ